MRKPAVVLGVLAVVALVISRSFLGVGSHPEDPTDQSRSRLPEGIVTSTSAAHHENSHENSSSNDPLDGAPDIDLQLLQSINPTVTHYVPWLSCPSIPRINKRSADGKKSHAAVVKYTRYVEAYCRSTGILQMHVNLQTYLRIIHRIAAMLHISNRSKILDFGCGCGTLLNYLHLTHNTTGVGFDITPSAVAHARAHAQPGQTFCVADFTASLGWLPSDFDAIISWSVIHHVRRKYVQCAAILQLMKHLRPGGMLLIGHVRGEFTQSFWIKHKRCALWANATMKVFSDAKVFGVEAFRRNRYPSILIKTNHS